MKLFPPRMLSVAVVFSTLVLGLALTAMAENLETQFINPPASARPWVYWYFMDGNLSREGMTADLEAMKRAGIGGAIMLEVNQNGIPRGPVDFMSEQWQVLMAEAIREAGRLGIEIALGTGPGWCGTGGPWLKPDQTMQHLVASETIVVGPLAFSAALPIPSPRKPYFGEGTLTPELKKQWQEFYQDVVVLAFPATESTNRIADVNEKALFHRDPYSSKKGVKPFLPSLANYPGSVATIDLKETIDLTTKLSSDGTLSWKVPPGRWTIMRFGRTLTGQTTRPAPKPGLGFESDKFNRAALDAHFAAFTQKLLDQTGKSTNATGGLTMLHFDSWEMGSQNWSQKFREEFKNRRGYDLLKFLPTFTGQIVGSEEISERFLWDIRQTAQELVVENHVGHLKTLAHQHGLGLSVEPYDLNPCADLTLGRVADIPQCEFWSRGYDTTYSVIEAASIAHTAGKPVVAAEAFTASAGEDWQADPASLKLQGDWAFCAGVNRFAFHRFQAQPWTNRWPGMTMGHYGVHWDRTQTWWDMASAYHEYLARCQFLLQRGVTVADVCFLVAEGAPHVFRAPSSATIGSPPDHTGYNFDGCAPETLLERAQVRNGRVIFPGGTTYSIFVLPERATMTPNLLRKIKSLVQGGATVFGPPPVKSPSLENFPKCDRDVKKLAHEIWGDCDGKKVFAHSLGKGQILWRETTVNPGEQYGDYSAITNLLNQTGPPPDFATDGPIRFTHRRDDGAEIYFLANREARQLEVRCQFRVTDKQPEIWNPKTGETRTLAQFASDATCTTIPLRFEPSESYFVVFRRPATSVSSSSSNFLELRDTGVQFDGAWQVSFDPKWGGPKKISFDSLQDWSQRPEAGIKYYSGTAVYRNSFTWLNRAPAHAKKFFLDLGNVKNLARVRLNGHEVGVVWCFPFRLEVSNAIQTGKNELEIEVADLWPNRLIGDAALPPESRFTWTTWNPYKTDSPLLPSGLLGPVQLLSADQP